jgi:hypothetical protein
MKLFDHRSGSESTSHVDHGPDVVNTDHPVYAIAHALSDGAVTAAEARIALGLVMQNPQGLRQIELASGLCDDTILKVIPEAGAGTVLLSCTNRGQFSPDETERRPMSLHVRRYRSDVEHPWSTTRSTSKKDQEIGAEKLVVLKEEEEKTRGARHPAGIPPEVLKALDPGMDLWSNPSEHNGGGQHFGDAGWVLAMVTGMRAQTFGLDELEKILRVGERQLRRIVGGLVDYGFARRAKEGRRVLVTVDFSMMVHEDHRESFLKFGRRAVKALIQHHEHNALKRLGTVVGRTVRDMWRDRIVEVRMLKDWIEDLGTNQCWDRLVGILSRKSKREARRDGLTRWEAEDLIYEELKPFMVQPLTA